MNPIKQFPQLIGVYEFGRSDVEVYIEEDLKSSGIDLLPEELDQLITAIAQNTMSQLPDGFQGGRDTMQPDIFKLYSTKGNI